MATSRRRTDPSVADLLFAEGYRFQFLQAVRLLERLYKDRRPVGYDARPSEEVVRFRSRITLEFPASAVHSVVPASRADEVDDASVDFMDLAAPTGLLPRHSKKLTRSRLEINPGPPAEMLHLLKSRSLLPVQDPLQAERSNGVPSPAEMTVNFMGLAGPSGVLPRHYTELILERLRLDDTALRDFLDLFNHRLISLFYRACEKYRFPLAYERTIARGLGDEPEADPAYDNLSRHLLELIGLPSRSLRTRFEAGGRALLFYAGLLVQQPRSAVALRSLLLEYFGVSVEIVQFIGQWLPLLREDRTRLGGGDRNNVLGESAVCGERVWDQPAKFRLRLGPLGLDQFLGFLPCGSAFRPLVLLTRFFVGQERDFDVQLVLLAAEIPPCRLGEAGDRAPRLGWSTWLKAREFEHDSDDVVLHGGATLAGAFAA